MRPSPCLCPGVGAALSPPRLADLQDQFVSPNVVFGQGFGRRWMVRPGSMLTPALLLPRCVGGLRPVLYRNCLPVSSACTGSLHLQRVGAAWKLKAKENPFK